MDGNVRWAKKEKISKKEGYQKGLDKIKEIIELSLEKRVRYLTLFALSSENIQRPGINIIFDIISNNLGSFLEDISKNEKVKVRIFGSRNDLPKRINKIINQIEILTKNNDQLYLNIAFNYGSKNELVHCFNNV